MTWTDEVQQRVQLDAIGGGVIRHVSYILSPAWTGAVIVLPGGANGHTQAGL